MDLLERVWKFLENLSLLHWLIALILIIGGFVIYFWKWIKLQFRFGKNLKRKIYFLKLSNDKNLETEKDQIRNLALFNIEDEIKDISKDTKNLQNFKKDAVYIIGYNKNKDSEFYNNLITEAKINKIPVIIFAQQREIKEEHWHIFNGYVYLDIANTTNRLAIILLNILKIV
jgi:hypothetical protein